MMPDNIIILEKKNIGIITRFFKEDPLMAKINPTLIHFDIHEILVGEKVWYLCIKKGTIIKKHYEIHLIFYASLYSWIKEYNAFLITPTRILFNNHYALS